MSPAVHPYIGAPFCKGIQLNTTPFLIRAVPCPVKGADRILPGKAKSNSGKDASPGIVYAQSW